MSEAGTIRLQMSRSVEVPARICSHQEFSKTILSLWRFGLDSLPSKEEKSAFLCSMYYLLSWMVGDAGKGMGSRKRHTVRIRYELSKKHPENLELGNYVMQIIQNLGVWCERLEDKPPREFRPSGSYYWDSRYSPIFGWMFTACLGLKWDERTSYVPVTMDWVLTAPEEMRIWFVRGLADSDGDVDVRDRSVSITSQPNTELVSRLLTSLGVHNSVSRESGRDMARVSFSVPDAARIGVFNPVVMTHRRRLLERLANARTFQRRWPQWLDEKVEMLIRDGRRAREVVERILEEDNVFIKMHTVTRKADAIRLNVREPREGFGPSTFACLESCSTKATLWSPAL